LDGINELASAIAWWLMHPWRLLGMYLLSVLTVSFIRAFFTRKGER